MKAVRQANQQIFAYKIVSLIISFLVSICSSSSETLIFMFLGVQVVSWGHEWNTKFVFVTLVFILVFRALGEL